MDAKHSFVAVQTLLEEQPIAPSLAEEKIELVQKEAPHPICPNQAITSVFCRPMVAPWLAADKFAVCRIMNLIHLRGG